MYRPTPISPTVHGIIDYTTSTAAAVAPTLLDFPEEAAAASYALAGSVTGLAATTRRSGAALRPMVPLKAHAITDLALGLALPALPWLLGFSRNKAARNFFLLITAVTMVVTALTDWSEPAPKARSPRKSTTSARSAKTAKTAKSSKGAKQSV
ncbi:MAG TPA: hypothetical protein VF832_07275 [Longimicrobiales bacterium]